MDIVISELFNEDLDEIDWIMVLVFAAKGIKVFVWIELLGY